MSSFLRPTRLPGLALVALVVSAPPAWPQSVPATAPAVAPPSATSPGTTPEAARVPVTLDDEPLFYLTRSLRALPLDQRARLVSERLLAAAKDHHLRPQDIRVTPGEFGPEIGAPNLAIVVVFDLDAEGSGRTPMALAEQWAERMRQGIIQYRARRSAQARLTTAAEVILATVLFALLLIVVRRLHRRLAALEVGPGLAARFGQLRIGSVRIRATEHLPGARITAAWRAGLRTLRLVAVILLGYAYLQTTLTILPWSYPYARLVLDHVLGPLRVIGDAAWDYAPNLAFLGVLLVLTHYGLKLVRLFFRGVETGAIAIPGFYPEWANPTFQICRLLLVAFVVVIAFPYLPGSGSPAFQGVSIFLGVLVSLGSTSAVANAVAGVILTYMRAFALDDFVRIGDSMGDVIEKGLLVTRIRTVKNENIAIPNSVVLGSHVTNYSAMARADGLLLHTIVTIGYGAPWRTVHELLVQAALDTDHVLKTPPPFVLQTGLNDFYVTYELNARTDRPRLMPQIYSDLHRNIQDRFNERGVEIMSPHYTQLRDGNPTTIPESYLAKGYTPPAHRVQPVRPPRADAP